MTTDITELAQNPTRYGTNSQGVFTNQTDGAYVSYLDFVALVEELEKAQGMEAYWKTQCRGITDHCEELQARIAELESRTVTVKLPDIMPPEAAPAHYWGSGESMAYADGYNKSAADLKTSFAQACSSAGVNVEFE
ncbi:TPA: hypothetical protein ACR6B4_001360 [Klebsiella variicola subsp. variicola]